MTYLDEISSILDKSTPDDNVSKYKQYGNGWRKPEFAGGYNMLKLWAVCRPVEVLGAAGHPLHQDGQ